MAISVSITYREGSETEDLPVYHPFSFFGKWVDVWIPIIKKLELPLLFEAVEEGRILKGTDIPQITDELYRIQSGIGSTSISPNEKAYLNERCKTLIEFFQGLNPDLVEEIDIG